MPKKIKIPLKSEEVMLFREYLLISSKHSLDYLNDLVVQINTIPEGEKTFKLKERYKKTETIPEGEMYHFFLVMNEAPFIGAEKITFNKKIKGGQLVFLTIYFF